jgi:hypothetical protein
MTEIELLKQEIKMLQSKLSFLEELEKTKTSCEEAYKNTYGYYPDMEHNANSFSIFQKGYNVAYEEKVDEPTKPMNEVLDRLENKYKDAEENAASYMTDEVVNRMLKKWEENPPEFLKFELGQSLTDLIYDWWEDVFTKNSNDDIENCIGRLVYWIEEWLPKSQSAVGSQNVDTELLVEGFNDALKKIKSKLR